MKPGAAAVAIDIGADSSEDFEDVGYPQPHSTHTHPYSDSLPLHIMDPSQHQRRRLPAHRHPDESFVQKEQEEDEDYSKDLSRKHTGANLTAGGGIGIGTPPSSSGRVRQHIAPPSNIREFVDQNLEHIVPAIYTLLACYTRFHRIGASNVVVWDEAHFGKFGSHYLKREFYFDVHPPLGKMIVGLAGLLSGYNGTFEFKSGETYPAEIPYVSMRVFLALFGVGMVPLGWYTAVELGMSSMACHLVALMVLMDIGWLVISRFILLDSMLLFFTFLTVFCLTKFHNQQYQPFSIDWYLWLGLTGFSIGLVSSVKLIGLFVTALVGLYTIQDLWAKFGDLSLSVRTQLHHWIVRIGCLIILPFCVYMASFKIHFLVLNHSGPGDAQMSSLFQANLVGNNFHTGPPEVAFGSQVTFKNMGWGGGLLHSHVQTYPTGSSQQQVTCYHYKDDNNNWIVLPPWNDPRGNEIDPNDPEIRWLKDGDVVRLRHSPTTRNLHSHPIAAPVTSLHREVSCYGNTTVGDIQDHWKVEVVDDSAVPRRDWGTRIRPLTTRLRFRHVQMGCYLRAANAILPQWGFKQIEVTCSQEDIVGKNDIHTYWNVEGHWNDRLPASSERRVHSSPFFRDFWHLNVAMWTSNNALIPDPDKEDILASKPFDWPLLHLGLRMCGWGDNQMKFYLLGNPLIWWGGTISLGVGWLAVGWYLVRRQRRVVGLDEADWNHFLYVFEIAFGGWFLHFVPFLIMGRVTYVHHYLPTLYFSVLMFAHLFDHFVFAKRAGWSDRVRWSVFLLLSGSIVGVWWWFRNLAWGVEGPIKDEWGLQWRDTWNIYEQR